MNELTFLQFVAAQVKNPPLHVEGDTLYCGEKAIMRYSPEKLTWRLYNGNGISVGYNTFEEALQHLSLSIKEYSLVEFELEPLVEDNEADVELSFAENDEMYE